MHDVLNLVCGQLSVAVGIADDKFVPDEKPPLERKGCCLAFNYNKDKLAYIPINRLDRFRNDNGDYEKLFDAEYRKNLAVQSSVRKCLNACGIILEEHNIAALEKLFNTPVLHFSILKNGIAAIYNQARCGLGGSLENSCMQGKPSTFFALYEQSPFCRLLVARDEKQQFVGRALLWECDNGAVLCDRRYGKNYYVEQAIADYAIAQGFYIKTNNNYELACGWRGKDKTLGGEQRIKMVHDITIIDDFPFCDTFQWVDGDFLCSYPAGNYRLNSTSGYLGDYSDDNAECYSCGDQYHVDDMTQIDDDYYCGECSFYCERCDEYCTGNDYITLSSGGVACAHCQDDFTLCSECDHYVLNSRARHFVNCGVDLCQECIA